MTLNVIHCNDLRVTMLRTYKAAAVLSVLLKMYAIPCHDQWRTQEFFSGWGVQQIQLRTEDRENGDLGAVAS